MIRFFGRRLALLSCGVILGWVANPLSGSGAEPPPYLGGVGVAGVGPSGTTGQFVFNAGLSKAVVCWDPDTSSNDCHNVPPARSDPEAEYFDAAPIGLFPGGPFQILSQNTNSRPSGSRATGVIQVHAKEGLNFFGSVVSRFVSAQLDTNAPALPPISGGFAARTKTRFEGDLFWDLPVGANLGPMFIEWKAHYRAVDAGDFGFFKITIGLSDCAAPLGVVCSSITLSNPLEVMFTAPTGQGTQILSDNETCTAGCVLAAGRILKSHMVVELLAQDAAPAGVAGLGATSTGVSGSILSPEVVPIPTLQPVGLVILTALTLATGRVALRKQPRRR